MDDLRLLEEQEALFSFKRRQLQLDMEEQESLFSFKQRQLQLDREEFELKKRRETLTNGPGGNVSAPAAPHNVVDLTSDEPRLRIKEEPGVAAEVKTPEMNHVAEKVGNINVKASIPEQGHTAQEMAKDQDDDLCPEDDCEHAWILESPQCPRAPTSSRRAGSDTYSDDVDMMSEAPDTGRIVVGNANTSTMSTVRGAVTKPGEPAPSTTSRMATGQPEARSHSSVHFMTSNRLSSRSFPSTDHVQPKTLKRNNGLGYQWLLEDLNRDRN